jgi:hypothetical protein
MLHACFTPIALCFVYTSWHFYAFSRTNLLTRCQSSCFLLFLCFRKVTYEIFSEFDETKREVPIFPVMTRSPKGRRRGARRQPHQVVARATPGHATRWCGPLVHPMTSPFRLYILSEAKTLKSPISVYEKFRSAATIKDQFWRTEVSVPAPYQYGEFPPEPSPSTPPPSPSPLLTPMMRRE